MKIPVFSQSGWIFIAQPSYYCLKTTKGAEINVCIINSIYIFRELLIFEDCVFPSMANHPSIHYTTKY